MNPKKIKLGICMAGAVSAGAYTAGVADYLMETLERWQIEKDRIREKLARNEELTAIEKAVPLHDVEIEVLSGASAGGMTASILTYSVLDNTFLTKRGGKDGGLITKSYGMPVQTNVKSKLYQSWVEMADDQQRTTLDKMLDTSDVKSILEMKSALNCDPIVEIAHNACPEKFPEKIEFPKYISPELTSYVTVTNLKGLPIDVSFSNSTESRNQYTMHSMVIGFKFGENDDIPFPCMPINSGNYKKIKDFAIATGAFPFGLRPHQITLSNAVMTEYAKAVKSKYNMDISLEAYHGNDYTFHAVDGGLLNNESYGVNAKHLKMVNNDDETNFMIYIDPFPAVTNISKNEVQIEKEPILSNLFFKLFGAARNQSMLKQDDISSLLDMEKNRFMIYPRKNRIYFIACGLLEGFSGFLSKKFRQHDYHLGRKNCQAFLRYYFGKEASYFQEIGQPLSKESIDQFGIFPDKDESRTKRIPLIPDMLFLTNKENPEILEPVFDALKQDEYEFIIQKLNNRISVIVKHSYSDLISGFAKKKWSKIVFFVAQSWIKNLITSKVADTVDNYLMKVVRPQTISQVDLIEEFGQDIQAKGGVFRKTSFVFIRPAVQNEKIITVTSTGFETEQYAKLGEYVVTNLGTRMRECYVITQKTFDKYELVDSVSGKYKMKPEYTISALLFTQENFPSIFTEDMKTNEFKQRYVYIEASWKESQILIENDFLVFNDGSIYRIGREEFKNTYSQVPI